MERQAAWSGVLHIDCMTTLLSCPTLVKGCAKMAVFVPLQASITVPYTGNHTMVLDSGANITIPVQGTYQGTTYAQAVSLL